MGTDPSSYFLSWILTPNSYRKPHFRKILFSGSDLHHHRPTLDPRLLNPGSSSLAPLPASTLKFWHHLFQIFYPFGLIPVSTSPFLWLKTKLLLTYIQFKTNFKPILTTKLPFHIYISYLPYLHTISMPYPFLFLLLNNIYIFIISLTGSFSLR